MNDQVEATAPPAISFRPRPEVELGRRAEVRVEKFLDAASEVFSEKGYERAKLSDIVARAGGSLATLYRVFGDKEGLAYAITERHLAQLAERLNTLDLAGLPPEEALMTAARQLSDHLATPQSRVLHRIVIGQGLAFPQLRDWFFDNAVALIRSKLVEYLEGARKTHGLVVENPTTAAQHFFYMLFGSWLLAVSCGRLSEINRAELDAFTAEGVQIFLRGVLPR